MIRITQNSQGSSSRVNKQLFEEKATHIYNTIVKEQIKHAKENNLKNPPVNSKNCNNPI